MRNVVKNYQPTTPFWHSMNREMEQLLRKMWDEETTNAATSSWAPAVDIREEDERFVIQADIPGVDPKAIDITMENNVLTIQGERGLESAEENAGYKRVERVRGGFYRRFTLPDTADADSISASGKNGVLEVVIPKHPVSQPRRIEVVH